MNNLQNKIGGLTFVILGNIAFSTPANALTFTIFTDEAAFRTAAGSLSTETFNSFTSDTSFRTSPVNLTDFSLATIGTPPVNRNSIDAPTIANPNLNINGTTQIDGITGNGFGFNVNFNSPITAFGATFNGTSDVGITQLRVGSDIVGNITTINPVPLNGGFYGFIASGNFSTITFETANNQSDGFGADNFLYTTPVPFEFSPAVGLGVLGGLWAVKRFRQKSKKN